MLLDYIPGKSITVKNIINDYTRQWVEPIRSIHYITMQLYIYILYTNWELLIFAEQTIARELAEFIDIIAYVNTYIYKCAKVKYLLYLLLIKPNVH